MAVLYKQGWLRIGTLLYVLAGFASIVQAQSAPVNNSSMTAPEAREALSKSLLAMQRVDICGGGEGLTAYSLEPLEDIKISSDGFQFISKGNGYVFRLLASSKGPAFENTRVLKFDEMDYLTVKKCGSKMFGVIRAGTKKEYLPGISYWKSMNEAQLFVDAVNSLIFDYRGGDRAKEAAEFEEFKIAARSWRELSVKQELSEGSYREKVLAEEAFREKDIEGAIAHYQAGLKLSPLWPQGHFNAALLSAEFGDFFSAARHMRRYLELVPDAPDAQAALDKSIIWEYKASQRKRPAPVAAPKK